MPFFPTANSGTSGSGSGGIAEASQVDSTLKIDSFYVQKARPDGSTYIVELSTQTTNEGGNWEERITLHYS